MARYIDAEELKEFAKRYIETEKLKDFIKEWYDDDYVMVFSTIVDEAPTEDVTPIKHAHWIEDEESDENTCSHCGGIVDFGDAKTYCQYCGAKMDEVIK